MSTSVTLTITKHDNGTVGAHLTGFLNGNQESMGAIILSDLRTPLTQSLVNIWKIIYVSQEAAKATAVERN